MAQWRVSGPSGAAKLLGVKPTTLADRIKKFKLSKPS
jgi:transcriptional regulator with GAF, ATPase, and Fis domain